MLACPACGSRLVRRRTRCGLVHACPDCGGRMVGVAVLRKERAARTFLNEAWQRQRAAQAHTGRPCPHCGRPMAEVDVSAGKSPLTVDVCSRCAGLWFDPGERGRVPSDSGPDHVGEHDLPPKARETLALARVTQTGRESAGEPDDLPDEPWQILPAILGMPVECDVPPLRRQPWLTWSITAASILLFLLAWRSLPAAVASWGMIPARWSRDGGITLLTSFLMHGGFVHLIANMYFLAVFGDNVEDDLGAARFVGLLAAAHLIGLVAHSMTDPRGDVPLVGASAGISGVIAYYAVAFPHARLGLVMRYFVYFRFVKVPAALAFVGWLVTQLAGAWRQAAGFSNVSSAAHLGGAAVGLGAAAVVRYARWRATRG